jgi:NADH-quinone oxidoreductase subunit F
MAATSRSWRAGSRISARALKAYRGYIFLRGEYVDAARHLNRAIVEAREAGLLGKNILGSGFDFSPELGQSGGGQFGITTEKSTFYMTLTGS